VGRKAVSVKEWKEQQLKRTTVVTSTTECKDGGVNKRMEQEEVRAY